MPNDCNLVLCRNMLAYSKAEKCLVMDYVELCWICNDGEQSLILDDDERCLVVSDVE
jgi:hypothetical protein